MKGFGYDLNPFTSRETLVNLLRLHSKVKQESNDDNKRTRDASVQAIELGVDVPKMNDHELRTQLNKHDIVAGPVISKN
jgi:hypothetical protein